MRWGLVGNVHADITPRGHHRNEAMLLTQAPAAVTTTASPQAMPTVTVEAAPAPPERHFRPEGWRRGRR